MSANIWTIPKPTKHMRELCKALGDQYKITDIDLERVIYRDFGNGCDMEISNVNTSSLRKKANVYVWKDRVRIVDRACGVKQDCIGDVVDAFYEKYGTEIMGK